MIKKQAEMILKYEYFAIQIQRTWNVKAKVILVITGLKQPSQNTQTVPEQHTGKARYRGITETSHIVHCTKTTGSAHVKVQNILHGELTLHVAQTVNTGQMQHCVLYKHGLFQVYNCKYRA